jgi:hypothetical protein
MQVGGRWISIFQSNRSAGNAQRQELQAASAMSREKLQLVEVPCAKNAAVAVSAADHTSPQWRLLLEQFVFKGIEAANVRSVMMCARALVCV